MISRNVKVEVQPSAVELAVCFCELNADDMAVFFNTIAQEASTWRFSFCFQLQNVTDSTLLNAEGRCIMSQIGDYGPKEEK